MKVLIGCPAKEGDVKPIETWVRNVAGYTHEPKEIAIASEQKEWLQKVKNFFPQVTVIPFDVEDWVYHHMETPYNRVYAIARGREVLRLYACHHDFNYLLYQDTDIIIDDPNAVQKLVDVMVREGLDALIDNNIGFFGIFNRDAFLSMHFYATMNMKTRAHYLEDFTVFDQFETYNRLGSYFKVKWAHTVRGREQLVVDGKVVKRRGD